jgi:DNA-binding response OmpR family regulator
MPAPTVPVPEAPILVVDDDAKIVRLVRTYLAREGFRVVEASDGRAALAAIALEAPALVVLDLMLPEVDGLAIIRAVRRTNQTPIVVISARGTTADRITGLAEGADDYLPKPFSPAELVVRVKRVLARTGAGDRSSATPDSSGAAGRGQTGTVGHGDLRLDLDRHETMIGNRRVELTALEFRLLATLLQARGRVLTRDQLMDALYGADEAGVLDRSVDALVKRLRDKLDDDADRPRYVATVRGVGYRSAPAEGGVAPGDAGAGDSGAGDVEAVVEGAGLEGR